MEKYGVDENKDVKEAEEKKSNGLCPNCKGPLTPTDQTNILHCKECGSLPFEA